jgi:hypothetical protein
VDLLTSFALSFGPVDYQPRLRELRPRLAQASLVPSRIFPDVSAWTAIDGPVHTLEFYGKPLTPRYQFGIGLGVPLPAEPSAYRGSLRLTMLERGDYAWGMNEELAIGRVSGLELHRALGSILSLAESGPGGEAGDRVRTALPRSARSWGRLVFLDHLDLTRASDGTTAVAVSMSLHPEGIRREYPRYCRYLQGFTPTLRMGIDLGDSVGSWWKLRVLKDQITLSLRVLKGELAPLEGPLRPMPPHLRVTFDYTIKVGLFRVGLTGLEGEVTLQNVPNRRAFSIAFRKAPDWVIPFVIEPFMKASLRRPFEGPGASYALGVEDDPEAQTRITQAYEVAVRETWIVKWLGGAVGGTLLEYENGPEEEAGRFSNDVLQALKDDLLEAVAPSEPLGIQSPPT